MQKKKQSTRWRRVTVTSLILGLGLGLGTVVAPAAQADDSILWECDFAQHACINHVRLGDGTVAGYRWSWDNNGNYWLTASGVVSS
jgi:hypothetical protein